jgi:hypothetical protein
MQAKNDWVGFVRIAQPYIKSCPDPDVENRIVTAWIVKNIKPYI